MEQIWHILRVATGSEKSVARRLGVPAYVPHRMVTRFHRKHRRVMRFAIPALPGMVFVGIERPREMNSSYVGVVGWMRNGANQYLRLTRQDFLDMRELERTYWAEDKEIPDMAYWAEDKEIPDMAPEAVYVGDRVEFKEETLFEGEKAVVMRLSKNRAVFRLIRNGLDVEADISHVAAA